MVGLVLGKASGQWGQTEHAALGFSIIAIDRHKVA